ncbi:hypothetical protein TRFO_41129 [Tritrichomonas foetus]|uniref:Uncharacterized protein n=1 Tax=Tritrichomonas foetus TaxID=1144522 RepID=A0A1J4L1H9_9EUKA|nr:hypothetical protein TRFO_41129 [Tritrichomonas foetus]|eukprot:OHT17291.1 hypothetical protein TRFO_41129 [Tritrichomonas foetus]
MSLQNPIMNPPSSDTLISDMWVIAKGLMGSGEAREKYSASWTKFGTKLAVLVNSQASESYDACAKVVEQINKVAEIHKTLSISEKRSAEDFRDIIERYYVVFRANKHYQECKAAYARAGENLENAKKKEMIESLKAGNPKNKAKLEFNVQKAKEDKIAALERLKQSVRDMLQARQKYNAFKIKRLVSGWTRYGEAMKVACEAEAATFDALRSEISQLRESGGAGGQAADQIEGELEKHNAENPPPQAQTGAEDDQIKANPQFDGFD